MIRVTERDLFAVLNRAPDVDLAMAGARMKITFGLIEENLAVAASNAENNWLRSAVSALEEAIMYMGEVAALACGKKLKSEGGEYHKTCVDVVCYYTEIYMPSFAQRTRGFDGMRRLRNEKKYEQVTINPDILARADGRQVVLSDLQG